MFKAILASLVLAVLLAALGRPAVRWPATDATQVVQVSDLVWDSHYHGSQRVGKVADLCLACGDYERAPHPHGSQRV